MGWYYQHGSRKDLVDALTKDPRGPEGRCKCLAHCLRGNMLWSVWDSPSGRWIGCDLLHRAGDGMWGHKPMDESVHPYYYTCPLKYLELVPEVANEQWRSNVVAHHEERLRRSRTARRLRQISRELVSGG